MSRLLSAEAAAKYCGISRDTFRDYRRKGLGPREFAPGDRRPKFAVSVLDEWMHDRDDRRVA